jgi:hypothetical protein
MLVPGGLHRATKRKREKNTNFTMALFISVSRSLPLLKKHALVGIESRRGAHAFVSNLSFSTPNRNGFKETSKMRGRLHLPAGVITRDASSWSPTEMLTKRNERKAAEKFAENMKEMSEKETWTVADMSKEIREQVESWTGRIAAKVPYLKDQQDVKKSRALLKVSNAVVEVMGADCDLDALEAMGRAEKLKIAVAAEAPVEDVNNFIANFQNIAITHRLVRMRKLAGKSIPASHDQLIAMLQKHGSKLMTKAQKQAAMEAGKARFQRAMRKG